jgi:type IV pilus assembly protein PilV
MGKRLNRSCSSRQRGMTLIEILVAVVVLSIGLLGLAGLQLKGMQVNQGSVYRWQAAMLAEDIVDRMRADRAGAQANGYTLATFGATPSGAGSTGTQAAIADWLARVAALPGGQALITAPAGPANNQVTIKVSWVDTRAQAGTGQVTSAATVKRDEFDLATEF